MVFADGTVSRYRRCGPCERESQLEGYGYDPMAEEAAAVTTATVVSSSMLRSVGVSVAAGLTIWFLTRFLDRYVMKRSRR